MAMVAESTFMSVSEEQIWENRAKTRTLFRAALKHGKHNSFKEHLENNPAYHDFAFCLEYGIHLVTEQIQQMSDVAPTLTMLLQHGAKWRCDDLLAPGTSTPYHVICRATGDHHELLQLMIKELGGRLVDAKNDHEHTALMYAVYSANIKCVETLIANGADANKFADTCEFQYINTVTDMDTNVTSPLIDSIKLLHHNSSCSSNIMMEIFDVLVDSVADVNKPCHRYQRTPIMYAAEVGNVKCVEKLIHKGAALYTADDAGYTVWSIAARAGNVDVLKCLIEDHGIDKNSIDQHGFSVLCWAVRSGNIKAVRYLLNHGITITTYILQERAETCDDCQQNLACHFINRTQLKADPYMEAISQNMPGVVKLLEEHGCQLYKSDEALSYAVDMKSVDVVEYLLYNHTYSLNYEYTANYHWGRRHLHQTLLMSACQRNSVKMIELLLEHGADPNKTRCSGKCPSAINVAINGGHVEIIARLIRGGVDVNTRSLLRFNGVVLPFEAAVRCGYIGEAEMLIVYGCSRGVHSLNSKHKLKNNINPDLQELLKEWEVDKNNVLPLKQRCRMVILNHLSPQADKKIDKLPLPPILIKYLSVPELDDIRDMLNEQNEIYGTYS